MQTVPSGREPGGSRSGRRRARPRAGPGAPTAATCRQTWTRARSGWAAGRGANGAIRAPVGPRWGRSMARPPPTAALGLRPSTASAARSRHRNRPSPSSPARGAPARPRPAPRGPVSAHLPAPPAPPHTALPAPHAPFSRPPPPPPLGPTTRGPTLPPPAGPAAPGPRPPGRPRSELREPRAESRAPGALRGAAGGAAQGRGSRTFWAGNAGAAAPSVPAEGAPRRHGQVGPGRPALDRGGAGGRHQREQLALVRRAGPRRLPGRLCSGRRCPGAGGGGWRVAGFGAPPAAGSLRGRGWRRCRTPSPPPPRPRPGRPPSWVLASRGRCPRDWSPLESWFGPREWPGTHSPTWTVCPLMKRVPPAARPPPDPRRTHLIILVLEVKGSLKACAGSGVCAVVCANRKEQELDLTRLPPDGPGGALPWRSLDKLPSFLGLIWTLALLCLPPSPIIASLSPSPPNPGLWDLRAIR